MWKDKLQEIVQEKEIYKEKLNIGVVEKDIEKFLIEFKKEFSVEFPREILPILKVVNGLEFNGFILYGLDQYLLQDKLNQSVYGFIEYNKIWHENSWQKKYLFIGESNISWYVYDFGKLKYFELDNPSGEIIKSFDSIEWLVENVLCDSLA